MEKVSLEIRIHLVPVLLADGIRLFGHTGDQPIDLERARVAKSPGDVTHLVFGVKR